MDEPAEVTPSPAQIPIRVFLLDDHDVVRRGIADLISTDPGITVVGEARTALEALNRIPAVRPDVAILDARLPDGSGIDVCRDIRSAMPEVRCVMLTSYDDDDALMAAVLAGASGYLLKEIGGSSLLDAIHTVADGRSLIDPALLQQVLARLQEGSPADTRLASLTPREREILALIADGLTNRQIGDRIFLSEKTVKNYVSESTSGPAAATPSTDRSQQRLAEASDPDRSLNSPAPSRHPACLGAGQARTTVPYQLIY